MLDGEDLDPETVGSPAEAPSGDSLDDIDPRDAPEFGGDEYEEDRLYMKESKLESRPDGRYERDKARHCRMQEELDRLTEDAQAGGVADFMKDFEDDEEYYEDDYDYGEGLDRSRRVKSESILNLRYGDLSAADYEDGIDDSDRSVRALRVGIVGDSEGEDHSLGVEFGYINEISAYDPLRDGPSDTAISRRLRRRDDQEEIDDRISRLLRSGATLDRLSTSSIYESRFSRLDFLRGCRTENPCRRVLSSDAVWLSSAPARGKKYKSNDEMIKRRQVVRFE